MLGEPELAGQRPEPRARVALDGGPADHREEHVGVGRPQGRQELDDPVMALPVRQPSDREQQGPVLRQTQGLAGLALRAASEERPVDAVGNHPNPVRRRAQPLGQIGEGLTHADHAIGTPEHPLDLRAPQPELGERHLGPAQGHRERHTQAARQEQAREAVRVGEVRVDQVERGATHDPAEVREHSAEVEQSVEALQHAGDAQVTRMVHGEPVLGLEAGDQGARGAAEQPVEREPRYRRHDLHPAVHRQVPRPLAHEHPARRGGRARIDRAQHQDAHHAVFRRSAARPYAVR